MVAYSAAIFRGKQRYPAIFLIARPIFSLHPRVQLEVVGHDPVFIAATGRSYAQSVYLASVGTAYSGEAH